MKYKFLTSCLLLALCSAKVNATSEFYVNDGVVICPPQLPPQVDATNFVNNNYFSINFTNFVPQLYMTASTRNFTNTGMMIVNTGFRFDSAPPGAGTHTMASSFVNSGTITAGSASNTNTFFNQFFNFFFGLTASSSPKMLISATNVSMRSSTNIVGVDGLFNVAGKKIDLNRAYIALEGFEENPDSLFATIDTVGLSAGYWGTGQNIMNSPAANFESAPPVTPAHNVILPSGGAGIRQLVLPNAVFYSQQFAIGTNFEITAVFLNNTNPAIQNFVYLLGGTTVVEWLGLATNQVNGSVTTNHLYLTDTFGSFGTNTTSTNFSYYSASGTAIPINYTFTRFNPFLLGLGAAATPSSPVGIFEPFPVTNDFSAFGAVFAPTTVNFTNLPVEGRYLTNLPGRIEITADANLDLTLARISGLNYMSIKATNHVVSTSGAKISVPFSDLNLATTNGNLSITNLLYPIVQRFTGEVDLWTGRWTNGTGLRYNVLFVDSKLDATAPSQVQDLTLRSTNIVIADIMNVTRNLFIDAQRLTITTNQAPSATKRGEINLNSSAITWSTSTPRLQYLTNNGGISASNAVFFGGSRSSPFYSSNFNEAYLSFVNHGTVTTEGDLIWANYFENTGSFSTGLGFGSLTLQSVNSLLQDGSFIIPKGDISISTGTLIVSNHLFQAGRAITLSITNLIADNGVTNNVNTWFAKGFNLPVKPVLGDLLHTTVSNSAPTGVEVVNTWAGEDRGCSTAGFANNTAIGKLILDGGGDNSLFTFTGAGANNAIYVDYLDLRNFTTNRDTAGNFIGIQVDPNMKVYFAQAVANGVSIAEKLDKQNDGRFCWVSDYAGFFSGTNVIYPDGTTNFFNAALVGSCNLDSDGDGLVNCSDPTPILRPQDLGLAVSLLSSPSIKAQVSWQTGPFANNFVYYKTNSANAPWQLLTNFVSGPLGGRVSVADPVNPTRPRFYRVRVDPQQP